MDPKVKQKTLQLFSNGMYIITSRSGERLGAATVTWVSQASFKPPLIMAAIRPDSNAFKCLAESGFAAIHILSVDQKNLAEKFFAPTQAGPGVINGEPFVEGKTNVPILVNLPAYVECHVRQILNGKGDHCIVIFEVVEAGCREPVRPLTIGESPWKYGG